MPTRKEHTPKATCFPYWRKKWHVTLHKKRTMTSTLLKPSLILVIHTLILQTELNYDFFRCLMLGYLPLSGRAQQPKYTYTNLWKEQRIIPLFCDIPWIIILHHARIIKSFHSSPLLCLTHVTLSLNDFLEYLHPRNATIYFWGKGQSFSLILIHRSKYISAWWCSVSLLISDPLV